MGNENKLLTLYPDALFDMSSVVPWMLSIGLDWVGMLDSAVPAAVLSAILSAMVGFLFLVMILLEYVVIGRCFLSLNEKTRTSEEYR